MRLNPTLLHSIAVIHVSVLACGDNTTSPSFANPSEDASADSAAPHESGPALADSAADTHDTSTPQDTRADLPDPEADALVDARPTWSVTRVDTTKNFKFRVAVTLGSDRLPRVAYNVATSSDGWSAAELRWGRPQGNAWMQERLLAPEGGRSIEFPSLLSTPTGTHFVFFNRADETQIDTFLLTSTASDRFESPVNISNSSAADEHGVVAALAPDGTVHAISHRSAAGLETLTYQSFKGTNATAIIDLDSIAKASLHPDYAIAVDSQGTVHVAYCKPGDDGLNNVLWIRTLEASNWSAPLRLTDPSQDAWGPVLTADSQAKVHVFYTIGPSWTQRTLAYQTVHANSASPERKLSASTMDRSYYLGLTHGHDDSLHLAFVRMMTEGSSLNGDVYYLHGKDGVFKPEEAITTTTGLDEMNPSIAVGPDGEVYIAYVENLSAAPHGTVYLAHKP